MPMNRRVLVCCVSIVGLLVTRAAAQTCCTGADKFKPRFTPFCPDRGTSTARPHFCFQPDCATQESCPGGWPACPGVAGACQTDLGAPCTVALCSSSSPPSTTTTTLPSLSRDLDAYGLLAMTHMNTGDSKMGGYTPGGGCHIGVNCTLQGTEGPIGVLIMNKTWVPEGTQVAGWKTRFRVRGCPPGHVDQLFSNEVPGADRCNLCVGDPPALTGLPLVTNVTGLAPDCACRTAGKAPWPRRSGAALRRSRVPFDGAAVIRDVNNTGTPPDLLPANQVDNANRDTCDNCGVADSQYFEDYWDVKVAGLAAPSNLSGTYTPGCGALDSACLQNGVQGVDAISADCAKQMLDAACAMSDAPADECGVTTSGGENSPLDPHNPCRVDPPGAPTKCTKVVVDGTTTHVEVLKPGVYRQVKVQAGTLRIEDPGRYVICELVVDKNKTVEISTDPSLPTPSTFTLDDGNPNNDRVNIFVRTLNVGAAAKVFWVDPKYPFNGQTEQEHCEIVRMAAFEGATPSSDVLNFSKNAKLQATVYAPKRDVSFGDNTVFRGRVDADDVASNFASFSCCKSSAPPAGPDGKSCVAGWECPPGWMCVGGVVPSDDPVTALAAGNCRKPCTVPADCMSDDTCVGGYCNGS